jgi:hypothetical protein
VYLHTKVGDVFYFLVKEVVGKPVLRNSIAQPSAWLWRGFKNIHAMSFEAKVIGCGKPTGSCSDNSHFFACFGFY